MYVCVCVCVCVLATSITRQPSPQSDCCARGEEENKTQTNITIFSKDVPANKNEIPVFYAFVNHFNIFFDESNKNNRVVMVNVLGQLSIKIVNILPNL